MPYSFALCCYSSRMNTTISLNLLPLLSLYICVCIYVYDNTQLRYTKKYICKFLGKNWRWPQHAVFRWSIYRISPINHPNWWQHVKNGDVLGCLTTMISFRQLWCPRWSRWPDHSSIYRWRSSVGTLLSLLEPDIRLGRQTARCMRD